MNNRERLMDFCFNYQTTFQRIDKLSDCEHNYNEVKHNGKNFIGCPQNFGLPEALEMCDSTQANCEGCWESALSK